MPTNTPVALPPSASGACAGVLQRLPRDLQQQALLGVHAERLARRDAEEPRVEADRCSTGSRPSGWRSGPARRGRGRRRRRCPSGPSGPRGWRPVPRATGPSRPPDVSASPGKRQPMPTMAIGSRRAPRAPRRASTGARARAGPAAAATSASRRSRNSLIAGLAPIFSESSRATSSSESSSTGREHVGARAAGAFLLGARAPVAAPARPGTSRDTKATRAFTVGWSKSRVAGSVLPSGPRPGRCAAPPPSASRDPARCSGRSGSIACASGRGPGPSPRSSRTWVRSSAARGWAGRRAARNVGAGSAAARPGPSRRRRGPARASRRTGRRRRPAG